MKKEYVKEFKEMAKILYGLRESHGYTQQDVAEKIGVRYQSYQAYELGISVPTLQNFMRLADLYEVSLDHLIGRSDI